MEIMHDVFLPLNNFRRVAAYLGLSLGALALSLAVIPAFGVRFHFFQAAIFMSAMLFGPLAGAATGAFAASYNAFAMNNLYIIGGNAILGYFAAYFVKKHGAVKAVLMAYAIQLPYLVVTDLLVGMSLMAVASIACVLAVENVICGAFAWKAKDAVARMLA
ncbi:MAG: hypothetical protein NT157_03695 [Candidatus Micrarchaeota archaeon]|nr:hypothetical protein [Candidatus Micrarchaeota archaeon]